MKAKIHKVFKDLKKEINGKVLLAVSGGVDSMTLWYLFRKFEIPHAVAHVNYGLRGHESDGDQKLVEDTAKQYGIECFVNKVKKSDFKKQKKGIQEAARDLRYDWFEVLLKEHKLDCLCTAHQLDDSVETFLMNLNRGAGLKGLGGIRSSESLLRPLLPFSRAEISKYALKRNIDFREDSSNAKEDYLRNWFRKKILKKWKKKDPAFLNNAGKSIENLQNAQAILDHFIQKEIENLSLSDQLPIKIPVSQEENSEVKKEVLFQIAKEYGFNRDQVADLYEAYKNNRVGAHVFSSTHWMIIDRGYFIIDLSASDLDIGTLIIPQDGIEIEEPFKLALDFIDRSQVLIGQERAEYLDANKLNFPLELRKWHEGDRMQPLGMKGKKKVSDILIDAKTSLMDKENVFVLRSKDEIICLLGYRISEKYKLEEESREVLRIRW